MKVEPSISVLAPDDADSFAALFRIYRDSIAPSGQKSHDILRAMVGRADYRFLLARVNGDVMGFATLFIPERDDFCLLEYLAVDARERGAGLGSALVRACTTLAGDADPPRTIVVEVDSDAPAGAVQLQCQKRIAFYERLGCQRVIGLSYILPLHSPKGGPPPAMELLVHSPGPRESPARADLERWIGRIYRDVYTQSADDPRIRQMFQPLLATIPPTTLSTL